MYRSLGQYVREGREALGLTRGQLVRLAGYLNLGKHGNRLFQLETEGILLHRDQLDRLVDVLQLDRGKVRTLMENDWEVFVDAWNRWADESIRPYLVIKPISGIYIRMEILDDYLEQPAAEAYASRIAREMRLRVGLVLSRRVSIWFSETGAFGFRSEAKPGVDNAPFMQVVGDKTRFLFTVG